jgi:hypothetical protein
MVVISKTEKRHECTNRAQLQTTGIVMATVARTVKKAVFTNFRAARFLWDRVCVRACVCER